MKRAELPADSAGFSLAQCVSWAHEHREVRNMRLGESLAQARKKAGLTQEAVAEKLGVSRQTISKWETDETLS